MRIRQIGILGWTRSLLMITTAVAWLAVPAPAAAEGFTDLYLGGAFPHSSPTTIRPSA
jgi:hypothetical protein